MENLNITEFTQNLLEIDNTAVVIGHINTDYDSICSSLSLTLALNKINKKAKILLTKDAYVLVKRASIHIPFKNRAKQIETNITAILMDMNSSYRAGEYEQVFLNAKVKANIDHHNNNQLEADFKFVDSKSGANCENVYKIILKLEDLTGNKILNKKIARLLLMGIITDTCNIDKSSNPTQTKQIVAELKKYYKNIEELANLVYLSLNKEQEKLLEHSLKSKQTFNFLSYYNVDCTNNFQNLIHNDFGRVLARITELDNSTIIIYEQKFSDHSLWEFRSSDIENYPVNEIALTLGGGGHKNASGATITDKTGEQVVKEFLSYFNKQ